LTSVFPLRHGGGPANPQVCDARPGGASQASPTRAALAYGFAVLLSVASATWFTRGGFFFQDDFIFVRQAQSARLSVSYLRSPLFQHFSPVSRAANLVLVRWFGTSYPAARALELALFGVTVAAFAWTVGPLVTPWWVGWLLTVAFGQSLATVHLLVWWTATVNILPATLFGLLTMGSFFRYRRSHRKRWAVLSLLTYTLSLGTHEQAWLVPGYLLLFAVLVLEPRVPIRDALARLRGEWWVWGGFLVLTGAAIANYFASYYASVEPRTTPGGFARFLGIQFTQAFAPAVTGVRPLSVGWVNTAATVAASVVLLAVVAVSVAIRRGAWRPWIVMGVGFLVNALLIGANRVGYFGSGYGKQLYYVQAPAVLFLLCVGSALAPRDDGPNVRRGGLTRRRRPSHAHHLATPRRPTRSAGLGIGLAALVLYLGVFAFSAGAQQTRDPDSQAAHSAAQYFDNLLGNVDALHHRGETFSLIDGPVPMVAAVFTPFNQLSSALGMLRPGLRYNESAGALYAVTSTGHLAPERFVADGRRQFGSGVGAIGAMGRTTAITGRTGECLRMGVGGGAVVLPFVHPVSSATALSLQLTAEGAGAVSVAVGLDGHYVTVGALQISLRRETVSSLVPMAKRDVDAVVIASTHDGQILCPVSVGAGRISPGTGAKPVQ